MFDTLNLKTPVPCIQGFFAERLATYSTQVSPKQIVNLLGHDPRSKNWKRLPDELRQIYEYLQRKTSKDRRESVSTYIEERFGPEAIAIGAFPAISIAIQQPTEFIPYADTAGLSGVPRAVGYLSVDIAPTNFRVLIDGLARATGALDTADSGQSDLLDTFMFPVTIFVPRVGTKPFSWREMGQLFHDFNFRVQPVSKQLSAALDTSDIYIALANKLAETPVFQKHGGVKERRASLGGKDDEIIVQTVLIRTVRGACEGRKFQEADLATATNPNLTQATFKSVLASIERFFTVLAEEMGSNRFTDRQSLHLTSAGWQALGVLHYDAAFRLNLGKSEQDAVISKVAQIDWSRFNEDWLNLGIGHPEIDKKTGQQVRDDQGRLKITLTGAGRTNVEKLVDYMRTKAGLSISASSEADAKDAA